MASSDTRRAKRMAIVEEHCRVENSHDLDALMRTFGDKTTFSLNDERHEGREAVRNLYAEFFHGFPDLKFEIKHVHIADDAIPVEMLLSGTHTDTWRGIPATGRRFEIPLCAVFIFDQNDKIAGERGYFDAALMLRQLGLGG